MITMQGNTLNLFGAEIVCVQADDETVYVPLKGPCEVLGIDHDRQRREIKKNRVFQSRVMSVPAKDGPRYKMFCLPLKELFGWLFTVDLNTVRPEIRETLGRYQEESVMALRHAQRYGIALNPRGNAEEIESAVRESIDRIIEKMTAECLDPRLRRHVLLKVELQLLGGFSDEPPAYRKKAYECMQVAIDSYFDWVAEYQRSASRSTSH